MEEAFENILPNGQGLETSSLERGLLFSAQLISLIKQHDWTNLFNQQSEEGLDFLSRYAALRFAKQYPDILEIQNLDELVVKIKAIYKSYIQLRGEMIELIKEYKSIKPVSDFTDYQEYRKNIVIDILWKSTDLLISGLTIAEHYAKVEDKKKIKEKIHQGRVLAKSAIESWFLIREGKYTRAVALLLPMIPDLPPLKIESADVKELKSLIGKVSINNDKLMDDVQNLSLTSLNNISAFVSAEDCKNWDCMGEFLSTKHLSFLKPLIKLEDEKFSIVITTNNLPLLMSFYQKLLEEKNLFNQASLLAKAKSLEEIITDMEKTFGVDWNNIKSELTNLLFQYIDLSELNGRVKNLIAIAGEVSTAENAGDVKKILQKYTLPVASYRIKRTEEWALMINAYTGGGLAWHRIEDDEEDISYEPELTLFAPVGFESSWRVRKNSLSLFLPIIDVGNIINYRINEIKDSDNDEDSDDDRLFKLENIISPGAFVVWGASKRFPFALQAGYQFNPRRFSLMVTFDLPLFRLK